MEFDTSFARLTVREIISLAHLTTKELRRANEAHERLPTRGALANRNSAQKFASALHKVVTFQRTKP
jgi:hypothetical protein